MNLKRLISLSLLLSCFAVSATNLCQSTLTIAQNNANYGISGLEDAQEYYETGLEHHKNGRTSMAFFSLKRSETALSQSRLQLVTSLFQLEKAKAVCESSQAISELSLEWTAKIDELNLLEDASADLFDLIAGN